MNENVVEQAALGWFEWLGYETHTGAGISPGAETPMRATYEEVVLAPRLEAALRNINRHLPEETLQQVKRLITHPPEPTLAQNNRWFHRLLVEGVEIEYRTHEGHMRGDRVRLLDFDVPEHNEFLAVRQFTVKADTAVRRVDVVVFVNGFPLVVFELKDLTGEAANIWSAFRQLQEYKRSISSLFHYNELMVVSDGEVTRVGSLTADSARFAPWRSITDASTPGQPRLEILIKELFPPAVLLDYLRSSIYFEEDVRTGLIAKKVAAYHQFRAIRRAGHSIKAALKPSGDGRGGVVWHTQGSGKSLTMLMLSGALISDPDFSNPSIVVVTDRNDLDGQLFATFAGGKALLRQEPEQAQSRDDLAVKLNRASGGVVFTTIQKFEPRRGLVSDRSNIVVLADEAHRSQYGFEEGGARWMRDAIPNATFVGFTGTPLELDDRSTPAIFGKYVDVYDIRQSINDGSTVPIYYEMRLVKLLADEAGVAEAERYIGTAARMDDESGHVDQDIEVPLEELVGAYPRLRVVAREIVEHFEQRRDVIEGKGMAVCMSRAICMDLYDEIVNIRPAWHSDADDTGFVKVVMSGSASEGERVAQHARTPARRDALAARFKDDEDGLRLVIVCDMWLTGFDCPPLHTMYLDKPLAGHSLMQAIARVNRVFGEKPGGVVVDFIGVADQLREAVQTYTMAGGEGNPVESIQNEAVPLMLRQYEALRDFFHGFDYSDFVGGAESDQMRAVVGGADFVFGQADGKRRFMDLVTGLSKAFALAVPRAETEAVRDSLVYFQAVRAAIRKRLAGDEPPPQSDARAAVRQVISGAVMTDGVIDLFESAGLARPDVGILSDEFLDQLAVMPYKNLALETLRKLMRDQIVAREKVNLVQSRTFRESLNSILLRYTNNAITTAQVIEELIGLARSIREAVRQGNESGLTQEELAFYDALADNSSAREVLQAETLKAIARELSVSIKAKASLDWTQRETVRADMRRTVRRLLTRYGYPPDEQEEATKLVIRQAELMAENLTAA